jgi:hypothetical protein
VSRSGPRARWPGRLRRTAGLLLVLTLAGAAGPARSQAPPAGPPQPSPNPPPLTPLQLEQLLAPIALYPDPLLGHMLMAATYPLEIVLAARWLQDPTHAALSGPALTAALETLPWDPSVKALVPFPQILRMMDTALEWTEAVGDAFLADQAAVMDAVQRLRQRAQTAGTLVTTPQQTVSTAGPAVVIAPADPQVVHVPVYDPGVVYGSWVYAPYPYFVFPPPRLVPYGTSVGAGITFGVGRTTAWPFWGWHYWDWPHHRLHVDVDHFTRIGGRHPPRGGPGWWHDPRHRHGVPYRDPASTARYHGPTPPEVRGYSPGPLVPTPRPDAAAPRPSPDRVGSPPASDGSGGGRAGAPPPRSSPAPRPAAPTGGADRDVARPPASRESGPPPTPGPRPSPAPPRGSGQVAAPPVRGEARPQVPPAFESFGRGAEVRTDAERGQASRQAIAPPSRQRPPTAPADGSRSGGTRPGPTRSGGTSSRGAQPGR